MQLTSLSNVDPLFQPLSTLLATHSLQEEHLLLIDQQALLIHSQYQAIFKQLNRFTNTNQLIQQKNLILTNQIQNTKDQENEEIQKLKQSIIQLKEENQLNSNILEQYEQKFSDKLVQQRKDLENQYDQTSTLIDLKLDLESKNTLLVDQQKIIDENNIQLSDTDVKLCFQRLKQKEEEVEEIQKKMLTINNKYEILVSKYEKKETRLNLDEKQDLYPLYLFGLTYLWKKDNISIENLEMMDMHSANLIQSVNTLDQQQQLILQMIQIQEQVEDQFISFTKGIRSQLLQEASFKQYISGLETQLTQKELIQLIK